MYFWMYIFVYIYIYLFMTVYIHFMYLICKFFQNCAFIYLINLFLAVLDYKWPSTFVWWETTAWSSPLLIFPFYRSTAALYKTPSYFICKHPAAHVSSPSLLSLLILNQQQLVLHCHVFLYSSRSLSSGYLSMTLSLVLKNAVFLPDREMQRSVAAGWDALYLLLHLTSRVLRDIWDIFK